jgi:NADH:ubiquinone oxidoreductase subunit 2 (subunit N)
VPHIPYTAVLALVASVIGAFVYLRLLLLALKKPNTQVHQTLTLEQTLVLLLTSVGSLAAMYFI